MKVTISTTFGDVTINGSKSALLDLNIMLYDAQHFNQIQGYDGISKYYGDVAHDFYLKYLESLNND